jgi:hypothetical protein
MSNATADKLLSLVLRQLAAESYLSGVISDEIALNARLQDGNNYPGKDKTSFTRMTPGMANRFQDQFLVVA